MMDTNNELDAWRVQWRHDSSIPADLQARVTRETRWMRIGVAAECVVTVVAVGLSIRWLLGGRADARGLAILVLASTAAAWLFAILNRWGAWTSATATTSAFLEISVLRLGRRLQALSFAVVFYAVLLGLTLRLAWLRASAGTTPPESVWTFATSPFLLGWWCITAVFVAVVAWRYRRTRTELVRLAAVRDQLRASDATGRTAD